MMLCIFIAATCLVLQAQCSVLNKEYLTQRELRGSNETIGDEVFYFGDEQVGWHDARVLCDEMGMRLVTLDTEARWTMVSDFVYDGANFAGYYWAAGHRKPEHSPNWHWMTSHEDFTFTAWNEAHSQPDRPADSEACMAVLNKDANNEPGLWWDFDCYTVDSIKYICESIPPVELL